jgi:excisionase family DNA binding protein
VSQTRKTARPITREELQLPFDGPLREQFPVILSTQQVADLLGIPVSTVYHWTAEGRFDGAFRKRGKHLRFWRDRLLVIFFNGPAWRTNGRTES